MPRNIPAGTTEEKLKGLLNNPATEKTIDAVDIKAVKQFLVNLPGKWQHYSSTVRNRLLKLLIEKVELRHDAKTIKATICWETGFCQRVVIQRARAAFDPASVWTEDENRILNELCRDAPLEAVSEALSKRTLSAIRNHARCLGLKRDKKTNPARKRRRWTRQEEEQIVNDLLEIGPANSILESTMKIKTVLDYFRAEPRHIYIHKPINKTFLINGRWKHSIPGNKSIIDKFLRA